LAGHADSKVIRQKEYRNGDSCKPVTSQGLTERSTWKELESIAQKARELHLRGLFAEDRERGERLTAEAAGIYLDTRRSHQQTKPIKLLIQLCGGSRPAAADRTLCFEGEKINRTEKPGRLHTGTARAARVILVVDGKNVVPGMYTVWTEWPSFPTASQRRVEGHTGRAHFATL